MADQYSKITITFNEDLAIGDKLQFSYGIGEMTEEWAKLRTGPNQVSLDVPTETPGERSAINFAQAFRLDYGSLFTFSQQSNVVEITASYEEVVIEEPTDPPTGISYIVVPPITQIHVISQVAFSAGENACDEVDVLVTTTHLAESVQIGSGAEFVNEDNPFSFSAIRGTAFLLKCVWGDGYDDTTAVVRTPAKLAPAYLDYEIVNTPEGATLSLNYTDPPILQGVVTGNQWFINYLNRELELEFSLDNITFQESNVFGSLPEGDYTIWVRDQFGCKISKTIYIDEFGIIDPYTYVSKSNAVQFAKSVVWGNCSNYKNDENTLSCEADVPLAYTEIQQFQTCDKIKIQFRSNFESVGVNIHMGNAVTDLAVNKMSNNMRLKDRRDGIIYGLGDGKTGIYFTSGDLYDYDLGTDIGDFALNGLLPEYGAVGNYVKVSGAWYVIKNIIFDEIKNAEVLVIDKPDTENLEPSHAQIYAMYNAFNYEVYEAEVDFGQYDNQTVSISISNTDPHLGNVTYKSELIQVRERHPNTVAIKYKNRANTDVFYSTGIEFLIRIPVERIDGKPTGEGETYLTDTSAILLSAEIHETNVFEFQPVTKQMMWKLVQVLSHSDILMDGVGYVKNGEPEVEGALEDTNLYVLKATMIKREGAFGENGAELNFSGNSREIPGLVDFGDGFVENG